MDWELWTSTNDGCGSSCDRQSTFKIQMRDAAVELQKVLPSQPLTRPMRLPSSDRQSFRSSLKVDACSLCHAEATCAHRKEIVHWQDDMKHYHQKAS